MLPQVIWLAVPAMAEARVQQHHSRRSFMIAQIAIAIVMNGGSRQKPQIQQQGIKTSLNSRQKLSQRLEFH